MAVLAAPGLTGCSCRVDKHVVLDASLPGTFGPADDMCKATPAGSRLAHPAFDSRCHDPGSCIGWPTLSSPVDLVVECHDSHLASSMQTPTQITSHVPPLALSVCLSHTPSSSLLHHCSRSTVSGSFAQVPVLVNHASGPGRSRI
jgi:hypothetical protein